MCLHVSMIYKASSVMFMFHHSHPSGQPLTIYFSSNCYISMSTLKTFVADLLKQLTEAQEETQKQLSKLQWEAIALTAFQIESTK